MYQWHRQENSIHGAATSISFTTPATDGGFSVSWDAENNINPIPPELMPKN
jgi:ribose 1,5-bisphosphokinase PhnN